MVASFSANFRALLKNCGALPRILEPKNAISYWITHYTNPAVSRVNESNILDYRVPCVNVGIPFLSLLRSRIGSFCWFCHNFKIKQIFHSLLSLFLDSSCGFFRISSHNSLCICVSSFVKCDGCLSWESTGTHHFFKCFPREPHLPFLVNLPICIYTHLLWSVSSERIRVFIKRKL